MTGIEAIAIIVTALVVPYVVQIIKTNAMTGDLVYLAHLVKN